MSDSKKLGRPIDGTAKPNKLTVRVDDETIAILDDYCQRTNNSRAGGVRIGIKSLKDK